MIYSQKLIIFNTSLIPEKKNSNTFKIPNNCQNGPRIRKIRPTSLKAIAMPKRAEKTVIKEYTASNVFVKIGEAKLGTAERKAKFVIFVMSLKGGKA